MPKTNILLHPLTSSTASQSDASRTTPHRNTHPIMFLPSASSKPHMSTCRDIIERSCGPRSRGYADTGYKNRPHMLTTLHVTLTLCIDPFEALFVSLRFILDQFICVWFSFQFSFSFSHASLSLSVSHTLSL